MYIHHSLSFMHKKSALQTIFDIWVKDIAVLKGQVSNCFLVCVFNLLTHFI